MTTNLIRVGKRQKSYWKFLNLQNAKWCAIQFGLLFSVRFASNHWDAIELIVFKKQKRETFCQNQFEITMFVKVVKECTKRNKKRVFDKLFFCFPWQCISCNIYNGIV